jgi:hypothetical protein
LGPAELICFSDILGQLPSHPSVELGELQWGPLGAHLVRRVGSMVRMLLPFILWRIVWGRFASLLAVGVELVEQQGELLCWPVVDTFGEAEGISLGLAEGFTLGRVLGPAIVV